MKKCLGTLLFFSFFFIMHNYGQEATLLNTQVPEIQCEKVLNYAQQRTSLAEYKGKAVLIDFWATWCAPCIKAFDHLQDLQNIFPNDLQVLTVSSDSEERLQQFLSKFETSLPIVVDDNRKIAALFPHRTIPHSVLIDQNGVIQVIASPDKITNEVIEKILKQEKVQIAEKKEKLSFDHTEPLSGTYNVLFQITLTPYQDGIPSLSTSFRNGRIMMTNLGIRSIYEIAHQFPVYSRTLVETSDPKKYDWNKENAYCLEIIAPDKNEEEVFKLMIDYLHLNFKLKSKIEKRKVKVKVLRRTSDPLLIKEVSPDGTESVTSSGAGLKAENAPINALSGFLEGLFNKPVIEETGLKGKYNIEVPFYNENPKRIYEELKKIGFELIDDEREIDMLILYEV
ncbi:MAG: TIGR03435 family protein [Saprospiraceae bacterium]|nr:TIGR03435 family protein [Saprospiraceae bacterium]